MKFTVFSKYYGGLNDVCPHRLIYSNTWSPVGGTLIGRRGFVGEGLSAGMNFEIPKVYFSSCSLSLSCLEVQK